MTTHAWLFSVLIAALPAIGVADIIRLPSGDATIVTAKDSPRRGATQAQVEGRYGPPQQRTAAVGSPPISRWDYADYSVYFEGDRVLHAVAQQGN